jgi:hypothetical protein
MKCSPEAAMEIGRRLFSQGLDVAVMDERSRALAKTRFEEAVMWAMSGLALAGDEPADDH